MAELDHMIAETRQWRAEHHNERRRIEAAACAIRERCCLTLAAPSWAASMLDMNFDQ